MRLRTKSNVLTPTLGLTPISVLGPNPYRKAFLLTPIAGGVAVASPIVAVPFAAGFGQLWTVPAGVTSLVDSYTWGPAGNAGLAGVAVGGGGGGGGGFDNSGAKTLVPGTQLTISVAAAGSVGTTSVADATGTTIAAATGGTNGALGVRGDGGAGTVGLVSRTGGRGATTAVATGGGGGGAAGFGADGNGAVAAVGGAGGGAANLGIYGLGGTGGNGGIANTNGTAGTSPGAAGGGGGSITGTAGTSADGLAVLLYTPSAAVQAISLSKRPNVTAGLGTLNFKGPDFLPFLLSDLEIGNSITDEWYGVSGVAGVQIEVTEYSYFTEDVDPAY